MAFEKMMSTRGILAPRFDERGERVGVLRAVQGALGAEDHHVKLMGFLFIRPMMEGRWIDCNGCSLKKCAGIVGVIHPWIFHHLTESFVKAGKPRVLGKDVALSNDREKLPRLPNRERYRISRFGGRSTVRFIH